MKAKILEALKTRYKNLGFSDKAFDGVAEYLSKSVTKDEEVEATVAGAEPLLKAFQGDADKRVTEAVSTAKAQWEKDHPKPQPPDGKEGEQKKKESDDEPEWVKKLNTKLETITTEMTALKQVNLMQGQHQRIKAKLEESKVPEKYYSKLLTGRSFKDDAEIEQFTTELVTGWEEFRQELADQGLGQSHKPLLGDKQKDGVSSAVKDYIDAKNNPSGAKDSLGGKKLTDVK